ncbi:MAG: prepilin-type N-terminal cleavage/methylation domain-containing protein [Verrucomicrobiota bacterium]
MTLRAGSPRGFTLLEILITLAVIMLFTGFFVFRFDSGPDEEILTRGSTDLRSTVLLAKKRAYAFRRDHYLVFGRGGYWLTESPPRSDDAFLQPPADSRIAFERYANGIAAEIEDTQSGKWVPLRNFVWRFRDSGLSEPLAIRLRTENSFVTLRFHALTGLAEEEMILN